jgi:hypothetical protein
MPSFTEVLTLNSVDFSAGCCCSRWAIVALVRPGEDKEQPERRLHPPLQPNHEDSQELSSWHENIQLS